MFWLAQIFNDEIGGTLLEQEGLQELERAVLKSLMWHHRSE